jgi:hypothetical protein
MTSPERERLAQAIGRHQAAVAELERVQDAHARITDQIFEVHHPAVRTAMDTLADSKRAQPARLVAAALQETPPAGLSVNDAEKAVADAERNLGEAREAAKLETSKNLAVLGDL